MRSATSKRARKIDDAHERELGEAMTAIDGKFERTETATKEIRDALALRYLAAHRLHDAELLRPGTVDALPDHAEASPFSPHPGKLHWADAGFIQELIARRARRPPRSSSSSRPAPR